ncbi:queuosine precursor transporter [Flaviflexus huanghaiensis]|uniref:queuosine precursor transporter n=1 Tax=Flaviflexus huanghaiensis TaxID=1111473 RepID=UPI0015FBEB6E|nr:queuosine precursor transporter [Flaviflexus huanghaiensis]
MSARFAPVRRGPYDLIVVLFVSFLLLSNIAATKLIEIDVAGATLVFDGGAILFPLTYILGDVISEVYGFKPAKRAILLGMAVSILASLVFYLVQIAPPAADYDNQAAFEAVLGFVPRIVAASVIAYAVGQLINAWVLVKIKERYGEKNLWVRLIGSTLVGTAADTAIFCVVAWAGVMPVATIFNLMIVGYAYKVAVELILLPVTYRVVAIVKQREPNYEEIA